MVSSAAGRSPVIPGTMQAWVLGNPGELELVEKAVPRPVAAEVLVRIAVENHAGCGRCALATIRTAPR